MLRNNWGFTAKQQVQLITLSPVILGLAFFIFSAIFALISINTSKLPTNFEELTANIENYEVYQLDKETNEIQWKLFAKSGNTNPGQTEVLVSDVKIRVYDGNRTKFIIKSNKAVANEEERTVILTDNVRVIDGGEKFKLTAGKLKFTPQLDLLTDEKWDLTTKAGHKLYGQKGVIGRNLDSVISTGNARIQKGKLDLRAEKIIYKENKPIKAIGKAELKISDRKKLKAREIKIAMNGTIKASGDVVVTTEKASCFGNLLTITKDANGKPAFAYLTGAPYAVQNGRTIAADKIIYDFNQNIVSAEGNVHTR